MTEHTAENDAGRECGEHYAAHPSKPHLVAVCTLPTGHDGPHDNVLPKRVIPSGSTGQEAER